MRPASLLFFLALAATTVALAAPGERSSAQPLATVVEGSFDFSNSRDGTSIFDATGIGPGDSVTGTVEIANTGDLDGYLALSQSDLSDTPGIGGGLLSTRLAMRIRDITAPAAPAVVYEGPLAPMPEHALGRLAPGESRRYEFVATLPDGGQPPSPTGGDNAFQGASTSVDYSWVADDTPPQESTGGPTGGPVDPGSPSAPAPVPALTPPASSPAVPSLVPLWLRIVGVRPGVRDGRFLLWARCDAPCRISARGRFGTLGPSRRLEGNASRSIRHRRFTASRQRLALRVPPRLLGLLRSGTPAGRAVAVRVTLSALSRGGARATTRRLVRLRR